VALDPKTYRIQLPLYVFEVDGEGVMEPIAVREAPSKVRTALAEIAWAAVQSTAKLTDRISLLADVEVDDLGNGG